ncbi:MAG: anthranilate phosphoribosyltransferase [Nitrosopumilus sp.]
MFEEYIEKIKNKQNLSYEEMSDGMSELFSGKTSDIQNLEFLSSLTTKGETDDELLGMLDKMNEFSLKIHLKDVENTIDMCGTGGDGLSTFNISTAASFVVASCGGKVAKHGNRSSGISGSADIFEYFGYDLDAEPSQIEKILDTHNICFIFAQKFHPAMKKVANARKQFGKRTAFNLLGPLSNPAGVKNQMIGVFSHEYLERLPTLLLKRGAKNIMTVRSDDGLDEFSTSSSNRICLTKNNKILMNSINPEVIGLHKSKLEEIQINSKKDAINSFIGVLNNTANQSMIETTALNAAGGLIVANKAKNFDDALEMSLNSIKEQKAFNLFKEFVEDTGDIQKIREITNG